MVFGIQPRKAEYTLEECYEMIDMSPIPFGDKRWKHSAIVIGNAGVGKSQYALAHFNDGLGALSLSKIRSEDLAKRPIGGLWVLSRWPRIS